MAAAQPGEYRDVIQLVEAGLACETDPAQFKQMLDLSAPSFINLLQYKGQNAEARAAVQSRSVQTPAGPISLDQEPDVTQVLLLSDELQLDELVSLQLVLDAQDATGEVSAAAAAGIFFEERLAFVQALGKLLRAQVTGSGSLPSDVYYAVGAFNARLLSHTAPGGEGTALVQRLAELIQSDSLVAQPDSQLPIVVDSYGRAMERNVAIQREHAALCECLLYAAVIKQRLAAPDLVRLLDVLHHLSLRLRTGPCPDYAIQHQASMVLLATLLGTLPLEDAEGASQTADNEALAAIASDRSLTAKVAALSVAEDPYAAVVKLAWGVLLLCGSEATTDAGVAAVAAGVEAGALGFLRSGVLESEPMEDEAEEVRLTAASVVNQLLMLFLEVAVEAQQALGEGSKAGLQAELEEGGGTAPGAAPTSGQTAEMAVDAPRVWTRAPDTLATLLCTLAAVLRTHPALFLDEARRSPQLGTLMGSVGFDPGLINVPSVFLGYVAVLTALAATQAGARSMFHQLRAENASPAVSWRRIFDTFHAILRLYSPPQAEEGQGGAAARAPDDTVLPAHETKGLCALAHLFERIVCEGSPEEVAAWLRQLEEDAGIAPSWEVLVQVMCCPVPQALKAALDGALTALARRPDLAAALWERLLAAVVVQPLAMGGAGLETAGLSRYDLAYQLNEIEARAEDYSEAVAFVRLLNALWRCGGGVLAEDGRAVGHFTRFVREEVLGTAFQRTYRRPSQCWELVEAALEHCQLCLEALTLPPAALAAEAASPLAAARPPGLDVLLDLLGERAAMRAALATLSCGVDALAHERYASPFGSAKEGAALAALRLLRSGFAADESFVAAAQRSLQRASYETLDAVLRHDRARIPLLLEYVRYPHNPALQVEALRLAEVLARRGPNMVPFLLNAPSDGPVPIAHRLQDGFAACLIDAMATGGSAGGQEAEEEGERPDPRASLVLDLLLACLESPTPNFTQLLCGYDVDSGMAPLALLDPRALHTPLRVALEALADPRLATRRPQLYEHCLELVYELAAGPDTGPATLDLLRGYHATLVPLLDTVACAPLPPPGPSRAASLHQRAWLLHLLALELHRADTALGTHSDSVTSLLAALFGAGDDEHGRGRTRALDVLSLAVADAPAEPQLAPGASPEVRRMLGALEVEPLLASPAGPGKGGLRVVGSRGDGLLDVEALKDEVLAKYNAWVAAQGAAPEALKEAGRAVLQYAAQYNAYVQELGGQVALLGAWQALVTVAFTRRFEVVAQVAGGAARPTDAVLAMAEHCLRAVNHLLHGPAAPLAPALCGALQAVMARLQEQALAAATADPLGGLPLPSRCHALLQALLQVAWEGRGQEGVRLPLYGALVSFLFMCRGPALLQAPPSVVGALLQGLHDGGQPAAEQLDAMQVNLEDGNVAALHANLRVLELMVADAVAPHPALATSALTALATWVAADPTPASADEVHRSALTSRLLQDLGDTSPAALAQPGPAGQACVLVAESQLMLLLRLALAGPPSQRAGSAQKLFSLQALPRLAACRALDLQPEEPGFSSVRGGGGSLRQRLHQLITPTLRLVLAIATALPHSSAVCQQTAAFAEAHARTLSRVLRDAASTGVRGWEPGDAELEDAALAAQLLAELAPHRGALAPQWAPALQEAAYRTAARFLCADSRSQSPLVTRLHATRGAGRLPPRDRRTYGRVLNLRCAVAAYLRALSADEQQPVLFRCAAAPGSAEPPGLMPTLLLVKDGLVQAAMQDLPEALGEAAALLRVLRSAEFGGADGAALAQEAGGTPGKGGAAMAEVRAAVAGAAAQHQGEIIKLVFLVEHLLAVLYQHLRLCAGGRGALMGPPTPRQPTLEALGSERDLDQLRRLTEPAIAALEGLMGGEDALPADRAALELLVRRTKEHLTGL